MHVCFMLMERNYVSELRLLIGLLLIAQVMYAYEEPLWSDIDRGRLLIRLPELSANPTIRAV
jgi:hypothetical protein